MNRRRLLFLAPTVPLEGGNGLAMRAGLFLEALAADYDVHLLVIPVSGGGAVSPFVRQHTAAAGVLDLAGRSDPLFARISRIQDPAGRAGLLRVYPRPRLCRFGTDENVQAAAARFAGIDFDLIHVMRVYLAPFAAPYLESRHRTGRPPCVIDLDECDSQAHRRLAALHAARGEVDAAALASAEAEKYEALEGTELARFDRVLVAAPGECAALAPRLDAGRMAVVPNAVRVPPRQEPPRRDGPFTILFVGTLGYFPNEDAALFFCLDVLPRLRALAGRDVRVFIVGSNPPPAVARLGQIPGVIVTGRVRDVTPFYLAADLAVAPLRAGGGARLKILEAFALNVPVVATRAGAEGLMVEDGRHLLVADGAEALARTCARLRDDHGLAQALAAGAYNLVAGRYHVATVSESIRSLYRRWMA